MNKAKPAHEIRIGLVKGAIWPVEFEGKRFLSVTLSRLYKSEDGWKHSSSFSLRELDTVQEVVRQAREWMKQNAPKR